MTKTGMSTLGPNARSELGAGLMFLIIGAFAAIYALVTYRLGTPDRMGPGFFPLVVGAVVAALGVIITVSALRQSSMDDPKIALADGETDGLRELAAISVAVVAFALLLNTLGLFVGILGMVIISRLVRMGNWRELVVLSAVLCIIAYGIFVIGLRMPFRLVPW